MSKKFLDQNGLTYLISKFDDYPTNDILAAVIDGIDEAKADRTDITNLLVDLSDYDDGTQLSAADSALLDNDLSVAKYGDECYNFASEAYNSQFNATVRLYTGMSGYSGASGIYLTRTNDNDLWTLGGVMTIVVAGYDANNQLKIDINNDIKGVILKNGTTTITLKQDSTQTAGSNVNITMPKTSGTLALLSDVEAIGDPTYAQVIAALGFTPYDSANPNHYITGITSSDVTAALGYTPYNATNPDGYLTSITRAQVIAALDYTPYNATNPNGYISSITQTDVTNALGYTPYNATNPSNFVSQTVNNLTNYYTKDQILDMIGNRFEATIVTSLPTSNISTSTIYMIEDATADDSYDEWMYIDDAWIKIGTTAIDMSEYVKTSELHNVAFTGSYNSLVGKPDIPDDTADLTNSAGYITKTVNNLDNYTTTSNLAAVALSGDYDDLTDKPTIPSAVSQLTNDLSYVKEADLDEINISTFINDAHYVTSSDISALENLDVDEIQRAIDATSNIGTVTSVSGGTGLTGSGTTTVVLNHSNSVSAQTSFPSGTVLSNGGSFTVRDVQYDTEGHITNSQDRVINMSSIPAYDDTAVRGLISAETAAREDSDDRIDALEDFNRDTFTQFVFCTFGIEPYIDPSTLQPVADRYYLRSDTDTGIYLDNSKIDIHLKAWLKYHYNITTLDWLKNVTVYLYAMGDHGEYVNHMVTFWSQMNNSSISSYPDLQQVGMFIDDGYGSVHRFTSTQVGAILSSSDDGYIAADPLGTGKGYVNGWNDLKNRVSTLEGYDHYNLADTTPAMDGVGASGSATTLSRSDHVHPSDTSREAASNKVSSWSSTTTNTHYPTEKLVKDTTDALATRITTLETNYANLYTYYTGSGDPSSSLGKNGDLYLDLGE